MTGVQTCALPISKTKTPIHFSFVWEPNCTEKPTLRQCWFTTPNKLIPSIYEEEFIEVDQRQGKLRESLNFAAV